MAQAVVLALLVISVAACSGDSAPRTATASSSAPPAATHAAVLSLRLRVTDRKPSAVVRGVVNNTPMSCGAPDGANPTRLLGFIRIGANVIVDDVNGSRLTQSVLPVGVVSNEAANGEFDCTWAVSFPQLRDAPEYAVAVSTGPDSQPIRIGLLSIDTFQLADWHPEVTLG